MLCESEFNVRPDVISMKRLGQPRPDRIQPMLITIRNEETVSLLIDQARNLRQSTNPYIRSHVFINRNMTRAEAAAAFQIREQRRQTDKKKQSGQSQPRSTPMVVSDPLPSSSSSNPLQFSAAVVFDVPNASSSTAAPSMPLSTASASSSTGIARPAGVGVAAVASTAPSSTVFSATTGGPGQQQQQQLGLQSSGNTGTSNIALPVPQSSRNITTTVSSQ